MNKLAWAWLVAIAASVPLYAKEESLAHFVWHLVYGASIGVLVHAAVRWRRPASWSPWASALAGYAYMVVPDLLWLGGRIFTGTPWEHAPWMDVFLFHVSLDEGGRWTWLGLLPVAGVAWAAWRGANRQNGAFPQTRARQR